MLVQNPGRFPFAGSGSHRERNRIGSTAKHQRAARLSGLLDGDSMQVGRIFPGDRAVVDRSIEPSHGHTATTAPEINLLRIEENLSAASQRLSGTYVENLPWLECAERYDRPHTFHYMDPPHWQTAGYGVDFPFDNYERMADFMRRCKGKVMVSINDHPDIRRVFDGFHFETTEIRYTTTNQRQGKAEVTGELIVMNWEPEALGGLF